MIQTIRKIGNSQGVLLPKNFIQSLGGQTQVDLEQTADGILIRPVHPRHNWEAMFLAAEAQGVEPDTDPFDGLENGFDKEEWTW